MAVRPAWYAKPHTVAGPVYKLTLECRPAQAYELCRARQVRLRQVNKSLLPAAFRASRLALKPNFLRHPTILRIIMMCNKSSICDIFPAVYRGGYMSRVSDIVHQRELFSVEEHHSVAEVARKMTELRVGA